VINKDVHGFIPALSKISEAEHQIGKQEQNRSTENRIIAVFLNWITAQIEVAAVRNKKHE
jgi:hypothetical protein